MTEFNMQEPFVLFMVAGATYAVRSAQVQQIVMIENITFVPNAPVFIDGVVYVRGQVIPVINLRTRFGLERIDYSVASRLVVIQVAQRVVGIAVDSAHDFIHLSTQDILPPPETLTGPGTEYLEGVINLDNRLILLIQLEALLNPSEKETLKAGFPEKPLLTNSGG